MHDLLIYAIGVLAFGVTGWMFRLYLWKGAADVRIQVLEQVQGRANDNILSCISDLKDSLKAAVEDGKHEHEKIQVKMDTFHVEDAESRRNIYERLGRLEQEMAEIRGSLRPYRKEA